MEREDFLKARFIAIDDDDSFEFSYNLGMQVDMLDDTTPVILWSEEKQLFALANDVEIFLYFKASSPRMAIAWANQIEMIENE